MIDRIDSEMLPQRTALNLRSFRQEMLASNIANADTPNYKARDIEFKEAFANAMQGQQVRDLTMNRTATAHLSGGATSPYANSLRYRSEFQGAVDGNTVNMDIERSAFAENAVHMEASLTFIRERFRTLASAVQGQ